jgi:putative ABC transport system ATP-binding protein
MPPINSFHPNLDESRADHALVSSVAAPQATLQLLGRLADATGQNYRAEEAIRAIESFKSDEPIQMLTESARVLGIRIEPHRLSLNEIAWLADDVLPVAAWSERHGAWFAFTRHGFFSARAWRSDRPDEPPATITRRSLAEALGLADARQALECGIVLPELPAEAIRGGGEESMQGQHGAHAISPVRRLVSLMKPEAGELWTITVFSAITGLLYLALPLAVNAFISNLSFGARSGPVVQGLIAIAAVLFVCLAVAGALRAIQHMVAEVIKRRIFVRLASDLSNRLPNVDMEALDGVHAPELVNRFLEVVTVQKAASMLLLTGINLVLSATIGLTVLAFYHPFLLAFALALLVVLATIVVMAGRGAIPSSIRESVCKYQVVDWLEELARHPRLFKSAGGAELAMRRADDLTRGYLEARRQHFRVLLRQIVGLLGMEVAAGTVLLAVGGWLVLNEQLTLGQLVAAEIIVSAIVAAISKLGKQFEAWYDAVAAVDKLGHLVDLHLERAGGEMVQGSGGMRIQMSELSHERPGQQRAFDRVTLEVQPGERVALLGSRGSGSSTLMEVLLGLRQPIEGHVSVDGLDVRNWDLPALRSQALLLREGDLITGTIAENLRMGVKGVSLTQLQAAVDAVGLGRQIRALPQGLATRLVTGGLPLPGRSRIRALVARALVARPRLLLLDEVLDGLDEQMLDELVAVVNDRSRDWTVLVATRDPRVAERLGRVVDLDAARVEVAHG